MIYPPSEPTTSGGRRTNREIVVALLAMAFVMAIMVQYTRDLWCGYASLLCLPARESSVPAATDSPTREAVDFRSLDPRPQRVPTGSAEPVAEPALGAPAPEDTGGLDEPFPGDPFGGALGVATLAPVLATQPSLAFPTRVTMPTLDFATPTADPGDLSSGAGTAESSASVRASSTPSRPYPGPGASATASATPTEAGYPKP